MQLTFLGAAGTVTGSRTLVEAAGRRVLVDCGLFQGLKELRARNWAAPPFDPASLDGVVLTHAHLDHCGYLPRLYRAGFRGPVWCTESTRDLASILLLDSASLQEEDARHANHRRFSRHDPALPLYTREDAAAALKRFEVRAFDAPFEVGDLRVRLTPAGHMLGAASVRVEGEGTDVVFSGDIGRPHDPLMRAPAPLVHARNLVVESTYGDRRHPPELPEAALAPVLQRVLARGGVVMIPAFAVGRAQLVMLLIAQLKAAGAIPDVPVFLNSPMAIDATRIFHEHRSEHRLTPEACEAMCHAATFVHTTEESKALNHRSGPMIIIAGSGMMTGGRILHHLASFASDPRNALVLVGFQAAGTRGQAVEQGADEIKVHGAYIPVRAEVVRIPGMSGHADYAEIGDHLATLVDPPRRVFIQHGEPAAADAMRRYLHDRFGWEPVIARDGQAVTVD